VSDFHQEDGESTLRIHEKGDKRRTIGIHFNAAQSIAEYVEKAGIDSGTLFRARAHAKLRDKLSTQPIKLADNVPAPQGLPLPASGRDEERAAR